MIISGILLAASFISSVVLLSLQRRLRHEPPHCSGDEPPKIRGGGLPLFTGGAMLACGLSALSFAWSVAADTPAGERNPRALIVRAVHKRGQLPAWYRRRPIDPAHLRALLPRLAPLHAPIDPVRPGDWLYHHHEPGQTFDEYLAAQPTTPTRERRAIYVVPIGRFTDRHAEVLRQTAVYLSLYFCIPVKLTKPLPLSEVPDRARRVHPRWRVRQLLSTYLLDRLLAPRLPADAIAMLGLTAMDLWPGQGWNFVFGQASLSKRVGVWSIHRNGEPHSGGPASAALFLLRTLKTATHETGHMLSMQHCTRFSCNMCGSNSRAESDRRPLALCPHCLGKVAWAMRCPPADRYRRLRDFCQRHGLAREAAFYGRLLAAARGKDAG